MQVQRIENLKKTLKDTAITMLVFVGIWIDLCRAPLKHVGRYMSARNALRFALINDEKVSAGPKLKGRCRACLQSVTAKCGRQRVWHWAHLAQQACDSWKEPETAWHRRWKDNFPPDWQEAIQHDPSGEKHIADVLTTHGLVIEFQHSALDPQEREARERFYKNMVWVVNGARLKKTYLRFCKGMEQAIKISDGYFRLYCPDECFPASWLNSKALVFFDFTDAPDLPDVLRERLWCRFNNAVTDPADILRQPLWCLLPGRAGGSAIIVGASQREFIEKASNLPQLLKGYEELVSAMGGGFEHVNNRS